MPSDVVSEFPLEDEYKKTTGITPQDIAELRKWLHTQPHLPGKYITDLDLILAYHCCNRSSGVTKQVLDLHFTLRTLFTTYFKDRKVEDMDQTRQCLLMTLLDTRSRDGSAIWFTHFMDPDPKVFNFGQAIRAVLMLLDLWQYEQGTWPGFVIVIDFEHMSLGHLAKLDLQNIQQFLYYLQEAILVKLKGLHFINAPSFIDKILLMMRPFMKKELMDILCVHQVGSKTLDKYIPMEALPSDAGGSCKTTKEYHAFYEDLGLRAYRRKIGHRLNARLMDLRLKRCRALLKQYAGKKYREILFLESLKTSLIKAAADIDMDLVRAVIDDWPSRLKACIQNHGCHFE